MTRRSSAMASTLVWAIVFAETALALAIPRDVGSTVDGVVDDYNAISDGSKDIKNGDYKKGWDKLPKWAKITIIVVAVVLGLVIIGLISCCVGCLNRTREVHHYHDVPGGTRNAYLPMNDMHPTPTPYEYDQTKFEPTYEPPKYATYEPMRH
ncbi:hypothetical protein A1Q2_07993 [Trichosporon asahii var. asahii CBS 8904]|uniref:Uncharacterized protein n=2 Tax=Trichosporon asahii var. asahii TaxID=189963 RepID=K1VF46_TRIAC|nr:hypothetical protein A1Q1_01960 [Trichosporon asahii var. asahii CBS 2479]EJT48971.1 hypothetical protein A1Q1_01960 [Trichosporon asahii var. asahii CBS 2479]EKC97681.1 hypothetical protein A1Q2_07993 [Trichosporon asahii var. asahii CBS 8904]